MASQPTTSACAVLPKTRWARGRRRIQTISAPREPSTTRRPEKSAARDGERAGILFRVGFGDLTGADSVYAHGGDGRGRIHQPAIETDETDAGGTQQDRQHLGAHQSNGDIQERSSSNDGRAFQNARGRRLRFRSSVGRERARGILQCCDHPVDIGSPASAGPRGG